MKQLDSMQQVPGKSEQVLQPDTLLGTLCFQNRYLRLEAKDEEYTNLRMIQSHSVPSKAEQSLKHTHTHTINQIIQQ